MEAHPRGHFLSVSLFITADAPHVGDGGNVALGSGMYPLPPTPHPTPPPTPPHPTPATTTTTTTTAQVCGRAERCRGAVCPERCRPVPYRQGGGAGACTCACMCVSSGPAR